MIGHSDNATQAVAVKRKAGKQLAREAQEQGERVLNRTLTRAERAVLEVVTDPVLYKATAEERMKAAGVARSTYFTVLRNPAFKEMQESFAHAMLRERIGPVIDAAYQTACTPGRDGYADRNTLLQMTGLHTPRKHVEQHISGQVAVGVIGVNIDDV